MIVATHSDRFIAAVFVFLLTLSLNSFAQSEAGTVSTDTVVVRKVAGPTSFVTSDGTTIELLGLTFPKNQALSRSDATSRLGSMLNGTTVVIVSDTLAPADTKAKRRRYVYLDSALLNLRLIEEGYAVTDHTNHSMSVLFGEAQSRAKSAGNGVHATERSVAVQCSATTKSGSRCRRMTTNLNGRCWQHQ